MAKMMYLLSSHGDREASDLMLELCALPKIHQPVVWSPMRLVGQEGPSGSSDMDDRNHYWRRTLLLGQHTGLTGLFKRHAGVDFSFHSILGKGFYPLLFSPMEMEIVEAGWGGNGGNYIKGRIEARGRFGMWWFFHLGSILTKRNDVVAAGDVLANFKRPGAGWGRYATAPHLHCHFSVGDDIKRGVDWQVFECFGRDDLDAERIAYKDEVVKLVKEFGPIVPEAELPAWLYGRLNGKGRKRWLRKVDLKPQER